MKRTLTGQLFLRILPTLLLLLTLVIALAFYSCRREINYVYDMQMVNDAEVLWGLVEDELKEEGYKNLKQLDHGDDATGMPVWNGDADDYGSGRMFRIWRGDRMIMFSDTALPPEVKRQGAGFSTVAYKGEIWRLYTMPIGTSSIAMELGEKRTLRNGLMWNILLDLSLPLLLAVPLLTFGLWAGIRRGLGSISALVEQIHRRNPDDLSAVEVSHLPRDLAPLGRSINRLFAKLIHSLSAERQFADHAAHQLRTPLAGSRLLIQTLADVSTEQERAEIIHDLAESNVRATELVNKLLIAARVSYQPVSVHPVVLYAVVARVMAELGPVATQKSLNLELSGTEEAEVPADEMLLALMATNVIENAIKYTPAGGRVDVAIGATPEGCVLSVTDSGPGIAEHERERVFQRFYRADGAPGEGTGLGLAIVTDIVERFGGTVELRDRAGGPGLRVEIRLPRA